ncbi:MAG: hypothetical protein ACLPV8_25435 [Steroidobacteraceae bacterium]
MNLAECLICWNPNSPAVPALKRGAFALVPDTVYARAEARKFKYLSGAPDARANDSRLDVRLEFAAELAHTLVVRDHLPAHRVHGALMHVTEYETAWQSQLDDRMGRTR